MHNNTIQLLTKFAERFILLRLKSAVFSQVSFSLSMDELPFPVSLTWLFCRLFFIKEINKIE